MNGGFPENSVWFELARGSNWRVLSYWKSTLLINFFFIIMFLYLLAASFSLAGKMECPMIPSQTRLCQVFTFVCTI